MSIITHPAHSTIRKGFALFIVWGGNNPTERLIYIISHDISADGFCPVVMELKTLIDFIPESMLNSKSIPELSVSSARTKFWPNNSLNPPNFSKYESLFYQIGYKYPSIHVWIILGFQVKIRTRYKQ